MKNQNIPFSLASPQTTHFSYTLFTCFKKSFPKVLSRILYLKENILEIALLSSAVINAQGFPAHPT